jgi:flap endonuclease GEN
MTVSSLWKVLDTAGCGKPIGIDDIVRKNNIDNNNNVIDRPQTLAVDLSIWICESMTTYGIHEQYTNPVLHLVFTRTMKLLNLGLQLIFVIEGKQRIQHPNTTTSNTTTILTNHDKVDTFRKRRSGTVFWKACNDCQQLLELLGVPVVRAASEGEALCALLSMRGIVDGVISNDGDCLLFGAKVIYTKYSNENLDNGRVMRYDSSNLYAITDPYEEIAATSEQQMQLSRYDLIAFAVLTGSDLAGSGLEKVGYKKAIRFIHKCQLDNPLSIETASYDEMKSWAKAATAPFSFDINDAAAATKCCTRCNHPGSKRSHAKDGCLQCGTSCGEECYQFTSEDRFRQALRIKALAMNFDPEQVFQTYLRPNENQLPMLLMTHGVKMETPNLRELMKMSLIVKGHSLQGSQSFVRQSVLRLLSRYELHKIDDAVQNNPSRITRPINGDQPIAKVINKSLVHNQVPSYEITWVVNATVTDANGNGVDGYEYVTIEPQHLVQEKYPQLVVAFERAEQIRAKQGDGMKNWRRDFLQSFVFGKSDPNDDQNQQQQQEKEDVVSKPLRKHTSKMDKKRHDFFNNYMKSSSTFNKRTKNVHKRNRKVKHNKRQADDCIGGDDIRNLLRFTSKNHTTVQRSPMKTISFKNQSNIVVCHEMINNNNNDKYGSKMKKIVVEDNMTNDTYDPKECVYQMENRFIAAQSFNNDDEHRRAYDVVNDDMFTSAAADGDTDEEEEVVHCLMGGYNIHITPIISNHGVYPPIHIFIRH